MRTPYRIQYILVYLMLKNCESHSNVKLSIAHEYYITYSKLATLFKNINLKIVWRNIFEKHFLFICGIVQKLIIEVSGLFYCQILILVQEQPAPL